MSDHCIRLLFHALFVFGVVLLPCRSTTLHTLPVHATDRPCAKFTLRDYDNSMSDLAFGLLYRDVQFQSKDSTLVVNVPGGCIAQIHPATFPFEANRIQFGSSRFNMTNARLPACKKVSGTWFIAGDGEHSSSNLYEDFSLIWYPAYIISRLAADFTPHTLRMTHAGGTARGWLAFQEVYESWAAYKPWELLHAGGTIHSAQKTQGCLEFENVLTAGVGYSWLGCPVQSHFNPTLFKFVKHTWKHLSAGSLPLEPSRCQRRIVYARRLREYRSVVNEDELIASLVTAFPQYEVIGKDLATLSMFEHTALLRQTHVFVFPHGGAGPMVAFLPHGASVVELFPYGFTDPMYRNMAVMSGKTYFAWQNDDLKRAVKYADTRNSNTVVDVAGVLQVVRAATLAAASSVADSFTRPDRPFNMSREHFPCDRFNLESPLQGCKAATA